MPVFYDLPFKDFTPNKKCMCLGLQMPSIPETEEFHFKSFLIFHLTFLIYFRFQPWFCFKPLLLKSGFATKSLKEILFKKNHLLDPISCDSDFVLQLEICIFF